MVLSLLMFLPMVVGCDRLTKEPDCRFPVSPSIHVKIYSHVDEDAVLADYPILFRGGATSTNGYSEDLKVEWETQERTLCGSQPVNEDGTTHCETSLQVSDSKVYLVATHRDGYSDWAEVSLDVIPSQPPEIRILAPHAYDQLHSNIPVEFSVEAASELYDPEDLLIEWTSDLDGALSMSNQINYDGTYSESVHLTEGVHNIEAALIDPVQNRATDSIEIEVLPINELPDCQIVSPQDGTAIPFGEPILFHGQVLDSDTSMNLLKASWRSNISGLLYEDTPSFNGETLFVADDLSPGIHTITLEVEDITLESCSAFLLLDVLP